MLTQRQEKFVLNIIKGMSQKDAWKAAGYSTNMLPSVIDSNASRLAHSSKVLARIKELRDAADSPKIMDLRERKERLSEIAKEDISTEKGVPIRTNNLQAIEILNKMDRIYGESAQTPTEVINNFVFVLPDGTKVAPKQLTSGNEAAEKRG